jgi:hypothetical protein
VAAALGAAMLIVAAAQFGTARAASSLQPLVLSKKDVPAGYTQIKGSAFTIQQAALNDKVSVGSLRAQGWLGDYESTFQQSTKTVLREIDSTVAQFKSASGARWDLSNGLQRFKRAYPHARTFTVSGIGDQALGIKISGTISKTTYTIIYVAFRRGAYLGAAGVSAAGKTAAPTTATAEHYASIIDGRLKHV